MLYLVRLCKMVIICIYMVFVKYLYLFEVLFLIFKVFCGIGISVGLKLMFCYIKFYIIL